MEKDSGLWNQADLRSNAGSATFYSQILALPPRPPWLVWCASWLLGTPLQEPTGAELYQQCVGFSGLILEAV